MLREHPARLPLLTYAFRPFFLAASLWAAIAIVLWVAVLLTGRVPPSRFDALSWHIHEMLFGFVPAAIAGFLLTAIATWTGRQAVRGLPLVALALLWAIGRITCLYSARLPLWLAVGADAAFLAAICTLAWREILLARNWRNLGMPAPLVVLLVADVLMYLEAAGAGVPAGLGWRLGLAAVIVLVSAVGGRIIPAFTRNWLVQRGVQRAPPAHGPLDSLAFVTMVLALLAWALFPAAAAPGVLLLAAAALTLWRLLRWRGSATLAEPLLAVLHLGYAWTVVGAALLGLSVLGAAVPLPAAIHALTIGAIGTMVLAVMTRVSLGHTGRRLHAGRITTLIYVLISAATLCRIAAAMLVQAYLALIITAAVLWVASFLLFAAEYAPILVAPRLASGGATPAPRSSPAADGGTTART